VYDANEQFLKDDVAVRGGHGTEPLWGIRFTCGVVAFDVTGMSCMVN